ncbi:aldose 1-epimerase [Aggregatilinea lenta]|uniref:aldose 1-epimerase n=1 Tax=Aggregatilinea lenta TaxID=913108 RepID=UPI000E5AD4C8|nr:aldose 1-epimerase [Aggregatilinea lenta]
MSRIIETTWHGQPAWALENDELRVVTVPGMGAKIVSLYHKRVGYEWLLGPADRPFRPVPYGSSFVEQDMSGWDEMFPTINACPYPGDGPYRGVSLPDHGEVWALPWQVVEASGAALSLRVSGQSLPYDLVRTLSFVDTQSLRMDYTLSNTSDAPLAGLWAAHPQFAVTPTTELRLPREVKSVVSVAPLPSWAPIGSHLDWPVTAAPDGQPFYLDRVISAEAHHSRKIYLLPDQSVGWTMLLETGSNHWLRMEWDSAQVPYLGIWADEGQYNSELTIAIEPSTGYYDSLELAWDNERVPILPPDASVEWSLTVRLGAD